MLKIKLEKKVLLVALSSLVAALALFSILKLIVFKPEKPKPEEEVAKAEVAIVIDDWGYNQRYIKLLKEIAAPITISILPNLRYSSQVAEAAKELGQQVIVHLPLEPETDQRKIELEKKTIMCDMSDEEILATLRLDLASVPNALGVSNHMGSKATKDERVMSVIFKELKAQDLFFLDNVVTDQSICQPLARSMKLRLARRDFFLDNENDYEYIRGQLVKLAEYALQNQRAVGVGHAKPATLKALRDQIPLMQAQGIKFVFVSELAK